MRYYWLNTHLHYACRHSGVCCTSGWPIPIEKVRAARITRDEPWLLDAPGAPEDIAGILATRDGHCVFWKADSRQPEADSGSCAVHEAKPGACAHFPYVCLIDQRGVHVTLSHYCPTAASLLFEHEDPIAIVEGPPPIEGLEIPEGLDARASLPPASSRSRLMSFDEISEWERETIAQLASRPLIDPSRALALHDRARAAVPAPRTWPAAIRGAQENVALDRAWRQFAPPIARYLAAKVHASWAMYLGEGPEAVMRGVDIAQAVLQVEVARLTLSAGRDLDRRLMIDAIRMSDLLLVHYASSHFLDGSSAGST